MTLPKILTTKDPQNIYNSSNYLVLDFETTSLEKGSSLNRDNKLLLACWRINGESKSKWGGEYDMECLAKDIASVEFVVAHNAAFELGWLLRCGVDLRKVIVYDTMLAEWVLLGNLSRGLQDLSLSQSCVRRGVGSKEDVVASLIHQGVDPQSIPPEWLIQYCHQDVAITEQLFLKQRELLVEKRLLHIQLVRCLLTPVLVDMQFEGLTLDKEAVYSEYEAVEREYSTTQIQLDQFAKALDFEGINWRSNQQVAEFLYDVLGFSEVMDRRKNPIRTDTGARKADVNTIHALKCKDKHQKKFIQLYTRLAKLAASLSKSLNFFKAVCDEHGGTFYGSFNQGTTKTHRLSSSGRPVKIPGKDKGTFSAQLQNVPREYKTMFKARAPDWKMFEADSGQLEFRVAAILTKDPVACKEIIEEEDVHQITADYLTANGEATSRQEAKSRCVPMYSRALTREGWKSYYELEVGEDICTYSQERDCLEWQPCLEKAMHRQEPTYSLSFGHNWQTVSTADHRWYGYKRVDHGNYSSYDPHIFTTSEVHSNHRIQVSSVLRDGGTIVCTPEDAAVIGWIITDGNYVISPLTGTTSQGGDGRRQAVYLRIIQKKAQGIEHIDRLLPLTGLSYTKAERKNGCYVYSVSSPSGRELLTRSGLGIDGLVGGLCKWVLGISREARAAFLGACVLAEGTHHGHGVYKVAQNIGEVKEAIHLAAFLQGHDVRVTITPKEKVALANHDHATMRLRNKSYINTTRIIRQESEVQDVWCPRTTNGTWVMRQGETVTITGNTFRPLFAGTSGTKAEQAYCKFFQEKYNVMYNTQYSWVLDVLRDKELITPYGMRYSWPYCKMESSGYIAHTTEIFNAPIQGFATAEIIPIALIHAWHRLSGQKVRLTLTIHDSVVGEVHESVDPNYLRKVLAVCFTRDVYKFLKLCYNYDIGEVPLAAGVKIGDRWGQGDEHTATVYPTDDNVIHWAVKSTKQRHTEKIFNGR